MSVKFKMYQFPGLPIIGGGSNQLPSVTIPSLSQGNLPPIGGLPRLSGLPSIGLPSVGQFQSLNLGTEYNPDEFGYAEVSPPSQGNLPPIGGLPRLSGLPSFGQFQPLNLGTEYNPDEFGYAGVSPPFLTPTGGSPFSSPPEIMGGGRFGPTGTSQGSISVSRKVMAPFPYENTQEYSYLDIVPGQPVRAVQSWGQDPNLARAASELLLIYNDLNRINFAPVGSERSQRYNELLARLADLTINMQNYPV